MLKLRNQPNLFADKEFVPSHMNGEEYKAGKFAFSLRKRLMEEHLGLMENSYHKAPKEISVDDPIAENFFVNVWMKAAHDNTRIYEEVFRCYPTNMVGFWCFNNFRRLKLAILRRTFISVNCSILFIKLLLNYTHRYCGYSE